ncbi:C-type lectin 1-like protein [Leptotrombidium deliense]|uniref:C-type lectin 1-like protein n=1 Tax=Leptotrombidium deliense TaxID=299467 RepID=A0A443RY63_9ACAR|nr:C-type lectin 1-like protein [Leptotrombidium deliense]
MGAEMVSVHSREQFLFLRKITQNSVSNTVNVWIGGRRNETNRNLFRWTDGSVWDYNLWATGQPMVNVGFDCAYMNIDWALTTCVNTLQQMCQKKAIAQRRFTVELELNDTVHRLNEVSKSVQITEERHNKSIEELRSFQNSLQPISEKIGALKLNETISAINEVPKLESRIKKIEITFAKILNALKNEKLYR